MYDIINSSWQTKHIFVFFVMFKCKPGRNIYFYWLQFFLLGLAKGNHEVHGNIQIIEWSETWDTLENILTLACMPCKQDDLCQLIEQTNHWQAAAVRCLYSPVPSQVKPLLLMQWAGCGQRKTTWLRNCQSFPIKTNYTNIQSSS